MEGQGDFVSRLIIGMIKVTIWVIGFLTYLLSPHDSPSDPLKLYQVGDLSIDLLVSGSQVQDCRCGGLDLGVCQNQWYLFRGPNIKDYNILGPELGSPYSGKLPFRPWGLGFGV